MKRICALALAAAMLAGCSQMGTGISTAGRTLESVGDALEHKSAPEQITAEEAQAIALAHAGFTADQVSRLRTQFEPEEPGDPAHYDVEFYQGDLEYDYEIHAATGEILSWERDR